MTIMVTVQNKILMDIIPDIASMTGMDKLECIQRTDDRL